MTAPSIGVVEVLHDGARVFRFVNGFSAGWSLSAAMSSKQRFDNPDAARLAWEINPRPQGIYKEMLEKMQAQTGVTSHILGAK